MVLLPLRERRYNQLVQGRAIMRSVRYQLLIVIALLLAGAYFLGGIGGAQPMPEKSPYVRNLTMTSKFLAADFVPDGNLSKKVWKEAPHVKLDRDLYGEKPLPNFEVLVASLWTPDYVYFAYHCKYDTLNLYQGETRQREMGALGS